MASSTAEAGKNEDDMIVDASTLNHLMYSIGRLKFTMRSLGNMNQVAVLPPEENENDLLIDCVNNLESNAILENAISETLAQRPDQSKNKQTKNTSSLEELEQIHKKLNNELHKIRLKYKPAFTEKSSKSIGIS